MLTETNLQPKIKEKQICSPTTDSDHQPPDLSKSDRRLDH